MPARSVTADLFEPGASPALLGSRCEGCSTHYFPRTSSCRNPACKAPALVDVQLSRTGNLYSYTVQRYRPPPPFVLEPWAPYALGLVDLPEGVRVMGMLTGMSLDDIRIGSTVELVAESLHEDGQGQPVLTYKFAPAGTGGAP
jgi:uncharacterized protein